MKFNIVTLFPEFFDSPLSCGLMGKAREQGLVEFNFVNPRDFTTNNYNTVDDRPYGGGPGMVMMLEPLVKALDSIGGKGGLGSAFTMAPSGDAFTQEKAWRLAEEKEITLICGRYEGIDARLEQLYDLGALCVGDYVLGGGETGALCVVEAVSRLLPGFMGHELSGEEESFSEGFLEYPHYTRPPEFEGLRVPEVLMSGHHGRVAAWRREQSLKKTLDKRPEMLDTAELEKNDISFLRKCFQGGGRTRLGRNLYVILLHFPVVNSRGKVLTVSLTNLDIHDIARCSCSYGLGGYYVATPLKDQQELARELIGHWVSGPGGQANQDRALAMERVKVVDGLEQAVQDIAEQAGAAPKVVATSAQVAGSLSFENMRAWLKDEPVLLVLGTGSGLAPHVLERADAALRPVRMYDVYNHLSVRSAASIMIDRILGDIF